MSVVIGSFFFKKNHSESCYLRTSFDLPFFSFEGKKQYPNPHKENTSEVEEIQARIAALLEAEKQYNDPGPLYDILAFQNGGFWHVAIDTTETGDLSAAKVLKDYA